MLRKRNIMVIVAVSVLTVSVLSFTKLGRYLYRLLWLDEVEIGLVYSQESMLDQELEKAIEDFRWEHPHVRFKIRPMHPNLYKDGQLSPVSSALDDIALVLGSSGQGQTLCEHGLVHCQWPGTLPEGLSPRLLEKVLVSGKTMGVPLYFSDFKVIYMNGSLVKDQPGTQAELVKLLREHNQPYDYRFGFGLGDDAGSFSGLLAGAGYFDGNADKSAALEQAFTLLDKLVFFEELTPRRCSDTCMQDLFLQGKMPFLVADDAAHLKLRQAMGNKLKRLPVHALSDKGIPMKSTFDGRYIFQKKGLTSAQTEAAQNFTEHLAGREFQERMVQSWLKVVARTHVAVPEQDACQDAGCLEAGLVTVSEALQRSTLESLRPVLENFQAGKIMPQDAASSLTVAEGMVP